LNCRENDIIDSECFCIFHRIKELIDSCKFSENTPQDRHIESIAKMPLPIFYSSTCIQWEIVHEFHEWFLPSIGYPVLVLYYTVFKRSQYAIMILVTNSDECNCIFRESLRDMHIQFKYVQHNNHLWKANIDRCDKGKSTAVELRTHMY
jgi:hypothetical protein